MKMKKSFFFSVLMLGALVLAGCQSEATPETDTTKLWPAQEDKGTDWGFIDAKGKFVISAKFISANTFSNGYAKVKEGAKDDSMFIDQSGKTVFAEANDYDSYFYNGVCLFVDGKDLGFVDLKFKTVCSPRFEELYYMTADGLAICRESGETLYGFCNKNGNMVIPAQFEGVSSFEGGVAVVGEKDQEGNYRYGLINTKGNFVVDYNKTPMVNLGEGIIAFYNSNDKYGLLNNKGNEILSATFDDVYGFSEGMAIVQKGEKYGYIDKKGNYAIEPMKLDYAGAFVEGVAWIKKANSEKFDLIDKKGNVILTLTSAQSPRTNFHNGLARVSNTETGKLQYIDKKGNKVYAWEPGGGYSYVAPEEALKADFMSIEAGMLQANIDAWKAEIRK